MADGAYFVGRHELLTWINNTLDLNLTKIEQTANGAVACQLLDALYNTFPMAKIDFNAKNEYDMINNYKHLQAFFNKKGIEKTIMVNKLIKGRPLDNMEFMQWLKAFFDKETGGLGEVEDYDAVGRRQLCKTGDYKESGITAKAPTPSKNPVSRPGDSNIKPRATQHTRKGTPSRPSPLQHHRRDDVRSEHVDERIKELTDQLTEMRLTAEESVREREFYYGKLREIEILCQTPNICEEPIVKVIEQILYAPNEEEARAIVQKTQMEYTGAVFVDSDEQNGENMVLPADENGSGNEQ